MAYAAAVEACVRHTDEAAARLEAFCKRVKPLRAQVEATALSTALSIADAAGGGAQYDASEAARRKQMGVYGARAVLGAACTCVSELAASSVGALGELGALSLQARCDERLSEGLSDGLSDGLPDGLEIELSDFDQRSKSVCVIAPFIR